MKARGPRNVSRLYFAGVLVLQTVWDFLQYRSCKYLVFFFSPLRHSLSPTQQTTSSSHQISIFFLDSFLPSDLQRKNKHMILIKIHQTDKPRLSYSVRPGLLTPRSFESAASTASSPWNSGDYESQWTITRTPWRKLNSGLQI